mgnify:CR=1 FL=1
MPSTALNNFKSFVERLIPGDKFRLFEQLLRFPIYTTSLTEEIYKELKRVFEGRNAAVSYQFRDSFYRDDWEDYRTEVLNEPDVWHEVGFEKMKTSINSIVAVDIDSEQVSERPEPYFYWLDINSVRAFEHTEGVIEWLMFDQEDTIIVIDSYAYRVFKKEKSEMGEMIVENPHGLGYCPATFFWHKSISDSEKALKEAPLTKQLSRLDWLLYFATSKQHLDLYAGYPIYWSVEEDCDYSNMETHQYCDGGYLRDTDTHNYVSTSSDGGLTPCPVCSGRTLTGAGSLISVPLHEDGTVTINSPVGIVSVDRTSLDYNVDEVDRLESIVRSSVTGVDSQENSKQAINEKQVGAKFASKTNVLLDLKTNFEKVQKFVDDTVCRLRYGDAFISSSIDWGTEFYIYTVDDLREKYKQAKEAGAADFELDALSNQILETEYRNNPTELQRMLILKHLEPYRHLTKQEVVNLYKQGLLDDEKVALKLEFSDRINKFERENINILEFASKIDFDKKIDRIKETLLSYGTGIKKGEVSPTAQGDEPGARGHDDV